MDITNTQWSQSVIILHLVTNLSTGLSIVYRSLRAAVIFIVLLIYEFMMCIVEAMLQVANPETDLRRSAVAVRVATIEQRTTPIIRTTKIIALPPKHSTPLSRSHTPEPTILIPEIVPFISLERPSRPQTPSSIAISAPVTPIRSPSPVVSQSSSNQTPEMSSEEVLYLKAAYDFAVKNLSE